MKNIQTRINFARFGCGDRIRTWDSRTGSQDANQITTLTPAISNIYLSSWIPPVPSHSRRVRKLAGSRQSRPYLRVYSKGCKGCHFYNEEWHFVYDNSRHLTSFCIRKCGTWCPNSKESLQSKEKAADVQLLVWKPSTTTYILCTTYALWAFFQIGILY